MSEALSNQEIDTLLSGLPEGRDRGAESGADGQKEVLDFDFHRPHRLSRNQLRTFQSVHETFAESLGSYLQARLQTNVTISVASVEQLFYAEFIRSLANPTCLYVFRIAESDALAVFDLSPQLILAAVERLMGGGAEGEKRPRLITRIEQSIVRGILQRALADLHLAWKGVAEMTFKLDRYESEGDFVQIAPASEIVMVAAFDVQLGTQKYSMSVCFPTFALGDVLAKLNLQPLSGMNAPKRADHSGYFAQRLEATKVPAVAVLGEVRIPLRELLDLEPGDILRTAVPVDGEVQLVIGGRTRMRGTPGISKGQLAVRINEIVNSSTNEE